MHKVGSRVILVDIEACPWINGSSGVVEKYDKGSSRYEVRLDADGTVKSVCDVNIKSADKAGWTKAYSRWLEGVSEDVALAVDAATEVTTVIVPGFILPKKSPDRKPAFVIHWKHLLVSSLLLIIAPLLCLKSPFAEVLCVISTASVIFILCSSLSRVIKMVFISVGLLLNVVLAWQVKLYLDLCYKQNSFEFSRIASTYSVEQRMATPRRRQWVAGSSVLRRILKTRYLSVLLGYL